MVATHSHIVTPVTISFTEQLTEDIYLFGFKRNFGFRAGQVIGISLEKEGPRRLYSICSGEHDEEIQILYNVVEAGYLTPRMTFLEAGDTIWITEPRGEFLSVKGPAIWIATGTGIAPFYSMFRSGLADEKTVIHGNRYLDQFYFYDEFHEKLGNQYIRCCSREYNQAIYTGRVTDYLRETKKPDRSLKYYLCGSAKMVVEVRDILIAKGVPFNQIISEIYF